MDGNLAEGYTECHEVLDRLPVVMFPAEAEWKTTIDGRVICSRCGFLKEQVNDWFCGYCGSKMVNTERQLWIENFD